MKLVSTLCLLAVTTLPFTSQAEVKLPKLFSSHMVLQRDMPIHIWGMADPGEQVAVDFHSTTATVTADKVGHWSVYLPAQPAGGPFNLSVKGSTSVQLEDILMGDLWMASGQSNMEMPLKGFNPTTPIKDSAKEIAEANYPRIRLFRVEKDAADYPLEDVKAAVGWSQCTPESAPTFSAVAYFFARALQQKQKVPIGLIDSTWGGTPAEAWTSMDTLGADAALMPVFAVRADRMDHEVKEIALDRADELAKSAGKPVATGREWHPAQVSWRPAALYNAMIAPFTTMPIKGVIWYQGESNAGAKMVSLYSRLFPTMIQDWRTQWHQGNLPFLFVQISAYDAGTSNWGVLRDAQRRSLQLVNTGMAVTIDVGEEHNIHPANKQVVGERLALLARNVAYGENIVASGPLFRTAYPERGSMHVWFENAAGLKMQPGAAQGFEVAGADGVFSPATATIEHDTVVASSPAVTEPRYVRYAWANFPQANLYNAAGLPASPFTSYPVP